MANSEQTRTQIIAGLTDYKKEDVEIYADYIKFIMEEKHTKDKGKAKKGDLKNKFLFFRTPQDHISNFKDVANQGLVFDGKHITLQSTGVSFDYVAYKNKMLLVYPETKMDFGVVYEKDDFSFRKENNKVVYTHEYGNPFQQSEKTITGIYCVIRNKRGEFLTLLSKAEVDKHRGVSKTDDVWKVWYTEMMKKTVVKKACKDHFNDVYSDIDNIDNENYDTDIPSEISIKFKGEIDAIDDLIELRKAYKENTGDQFKIRYINKRGATIKAQEKEQKEKEKADANS